ncbi:L-histidine N(alpha)-methyltransferase [Dokdonia sp. Hel_I_53]|uniref:L-histidine N(alpha)-methyltransferase n=1 Tax=Dokdonia sp. Hel_I_53 TaxID=1566287 RepID=UPI00119C2ADA|nr:L-histidine N(alpha)-methyltransferase [Dokdonia sp. Hel_I_53]TVZ52974.1 dimethylhistidine N-methyltransferase [Dokdonia sp. Hel_I_53]
MTTKRKITYASNFEKDTAEGLSSFPKYLSSKYIYDKKGDKLFQDIMEMPSYYLTGAEFEILETHKEAISEAFTSPSGFDLIELGAGDGKKTKILLRHLVSRDDDFCYLPIDISHNVLEGLEKSVQEELPKVDIKPQQGSYFDVLESVADYNSRKKVIMVLGSNIGNLLHPQAIDFLTNIQEAMSQKDLLFMGFDQKKNPQTILDAYNDPEGITAAFNKNLLHRINDEMDANFDVDSFKHWEVYNPESGTAKSYLVSTKEQSVSINSLGLTIHFTPWESIHTEISQKYDDTIVEWLSGESGLQIIDQFTDKNSYYKNYVFTKR